MTQYGPIASILGAYVKVFHRRTSIAPVSAPLRLRNPSWKTLNLSDQAVESGTLDPVVKGVAHAGWFYWATRALTVAQTTAVAEGKEPCEKRGDHDNESMS